MAIVTPVVAAAVEIVTPVVAAAVEIGGSGVSAGVMGPGREYPSVPLPKIAWLMTVVICVVAALILLLSDYYGYAGVVLAVALAAAINLR